MSFAQVPAPGPRRRQGRSRPRSQCGDDRTQQRDRQPARVRGVVGIELVCGAQALDFFDDLTPGVGTTAAYESVRSEVEGLDEDRPLHRDIDAARELIRSGKLDDRVESVVGEPLD